MPSCEFNLMNLKKRRRKLCNKVNVSGENENGETGNPKDLDDVDEEYEDNDDDDDEDNEAGSDEIYHHAHLHHHLKLHPDMMNLNRRGDVSNDDEDSDEDDDDDDDDDEEEEDSEDEEEDEEENDGLIFEEAEEEWTPGEGLIRDRKIIQGCVVSQFNGGVLNKAGAAGAIRKWKFDDKCITTRSLSAHT